ncbi:hypothetical protein BVC80_757g48 [Macleaya cordata]|uniref:Uncharacterized protein n=1 Tax=Macleaya cordata TaxID=56857 RepID=A0A200QRZ9_MACCD|nr:hypothetical protein BVC80_757g48 [Macleaya cordata]
MTLISDVITDGNGLDFNFCRVVNNEERRSLIDLVQLLDQMSPLGEGEDKIKCKFAATNHFSAKECYLESAREVIKTWERPPLYGRPTMIWKLISFAIWWSVWLSRNECAFNSKEVLLDDLICKAKGHMFLWGVRGEVFRGYCFLDLLNNWEALMSG